MLIQKRCGVNGTFCRVNRFTYTINLFSLPLFLQILCLFNACAWLNSFLQLGEPDFDSFGVNPSLVLLRPRIWFLGVGTLLFVRVNIVNNMVVNDRKLSQLTHFQLFRIQCSNIDYILNRSSYSLQQLCIINDLKYEYLNSYLSRCYIVDFRFSISINLEKQMLISFSHK